MPQSDKPFASSPYEHAFGSLLLRAYPPGADDARNAEFVSPGLLAQLARQSPLVGRLEAFGNFPAAGAASWSRIPGSGGRYEAGTAQGGLAFMPPDFGIENLITGTQPPVTSPTPHFTFWGSRLGFGTPLKTGLTGTGFTVRLNTAAGAQDLVVDTVNAAGAAAATQALRLDSVNSIAYAYGQPIVTGTAVTPSSYSNSNLAGASGVTTTETVLLSTKPMPASTLVAGSILRFTVNGIATSSVANAVNFRLRFGTAGTTSDTSLGALGIFAAAAGTGIQFTIQIDVVVRTDGVSGTAGATLKVYNQGAGGISAFTYQQIGNTGLTSLNTPTSNGIMTLTGVTAGATTTFDMYTTSSVEVVKI